MEELRPGLWHWSAPHPDWTPDQAGPEGWDEQVESYAWDAGETFVLFDPIAPPRLVDELAAGKEVAVLLTCAWHRRSAKEAVERLGAGLYAPEGDQDTAAPATRYAIGDTLPGGVVAYPGCFGGEALLWLPEARALVAGDVLVGREGGPETVPETWLPEGLTREQLHSRLRALLELPIELLLLTHGEPVREQGRATLERALAPSE